MFLIALLAIALALLYAYAKKKHSYWTSLGVKQSTPNFFFGSLGENALGRKSFADVLLEQCRIFKNDRYFGVYQMYRPTLVVLDQDLIADITVKHFDSFVDHQNHSNEDIDPYFSKCVFSLTGKDWHGMRTTLSPAFTGSKMKFMFPLVDEVGRNFVEFLDKQGKSMLVLEMKDAFSKATSDMITSCALGIKCDTLADPDNDFYVLNSRSYNFKGLRKMIFFTWNSAPRLTKLLGLKFFPDDLVKFIRDVLSQSARLREEQNIVRPDLVHLLLQARKADGGKLSEEEIAAQIMIFFFGGYDTSSFLMHFLAYELAVNKEVQEKLRSAIDEVFDGEGLSYQAIMQLKYFDMVVSETQRKYPIVVFLDRIATKDYKIAPRRQGEKEVHLKKGDSVWIPVLGIHMDPKIYPDPERFDPERFSSENAANVGTYSYIPFGVGPRNCIGSRFAMMQTKTLFAHLIRNYELFPVEKTKIPVTFDKTATFLASEGGMWLGLKKRTHI